MSEANTTATAAEPQVLTELDGHVFTVTINRPAARNALNLEVLARLADAWVEAESNPAIRVVVLTGAGGVFSAGADLKEMHGDQSANPWHDRFNKEKGGDPELHWKAFLRSKRLSKPIIAAVEGYAYAGGTEILQATDIRVSGASAKFGLTEAKRGLFPLGGSTVRLPRQVPYTKALEILLLAEPISAQEAHQIGLVGRLVEDGQALAEAKRLAGIIAGNGPLAVQAILRAVRESASLPEKEALAKELEIGWPIVQSEDAREGARAFAEKRPAVFKGR